MPLLMVGLTVIMLLLPMRRFKLNGFLSLLIVASLVALWASLTGQLIYRKSRLRGWAVNWAKQLS